MDFIQKVDSPEQFVSIVERCIAAGQNWEGVDLNSLGLNLQFENLGNINVNELGDSRKSYEPTIEEIAEYIDAIYEVPVDQNPDTDYDNQLPRPSRFSPNEQVFEMEKEGDFLLIVGKIHGRARTDTKKKVEDFELKINIALEFQKREQAEDFEGQIAESLSN